jgi:hypothetical protein
MSMLGEVEYFRLLIGGDSSDPGECPAVGDSKCSTLIEDLAARGGPVRSVDVSEPFLSC